jgi:hypothetical protein
MCPPPRRRHPGHKCPFDMLYSFLWVISLSDSVPKAQAPPPAGVKRRMRQVDQISLYACLYVCLSWREAGRQKPDGKSTRLSFHI